MSIPADESTLGILDIDNLCNDFDSVLFADKLNQTANALAKRQESMRQSLRSSYSKSPKMLDLLGNEHIQKPATTSEDFETTSGPLTTTSLNFPNCGKGLDSKYFLEETTFEPSSLCCSDEFSNTAINNHLVAIDSSTLVETQVFKTANDVSNADSTTLKMNQMTVPDKSFLESHANIGTTERLTFLPEEMTARSTSVHDLMQRPLQVSNSWNISGFSVDFNENADSGISSAPNQVIEEFLSGGDALHVLDKDEEEFQAVHALEISDNHDFGNSTQIDSLTGLSLTASKVFGHQSWMLGGGPERPSLGMVLCSPVRHVDSMLPSVHTTSLIGEKRSSDACNTSCSVPKQKPERRGLVTKRFTHVVSNSPELTTRPTTPFPKNLNSPFQTPESLSSTLVNSSIKCGSQASDRNDCSSSLPISPVPLISSASCQCSSSQSHSSLSSSSCSSDGVLPTRTNQVAPFQWIKTQQGISANIQQQAVCSNLQQSFENVCSTDLSPITMCLGELTEYPVTVYNPFSENLHCLVNLTGVFSTEQSLCHNDIKQLISWNHKGDTLLPNQKKKIMVSFLARRPGQLCLTLELEWSRMNQPNISVKMGKSYCLLNCDVVLPKVNIPSKNLKIKYHTFSNSAETTSLTLLNHTPAPVTVALNILLSGGEDVMWSDGELFFVQDHLHQYSTNCAHQWLNTSSPFTLSVCLTAGSAEIPSRAEIPISFRRGQSTDQSENLCKTEYSATVIVSQKNFQPARSLAALRISVVPSPVPLCSSLSSDTTSKLDSVSLGKETPIIRSRKQVYFYATDVNGCRKEEIILKNAGPECSVSASIQQENPAFQLYSDPEQSSDTEWLLKKKDDLSLTVAFKPKDKIIYQAALVINAVTAGNCSTSYKILLHGCGGCSKLSLHGCSTNGEPLQRQLKSLRFSKGVGEEKQLVILNRGWRPAFVSMAKTSGSIKISVSKFVVLPLSQKILTLTCCSRNLNESLLVFYGEEQLRQALLKKLPSLKKPGLLNRFDAVGYFEDQNLVPSEPLYSLKDTTAIGELFYRHVSHFDIQLLYSNNETINNSSLLEATLSSD